MRRYPFYNAFVDTSPSHHTHGYWRTEDGSIQRDYNNFTHWIRMAETLERGLFDTLFIADGVGVYDTYRGGHTTAVSQPMQFPLPDPASYVAALSTRTENLGFAITSNIFQSHPFEFARRIATLDALTGGRMAWNMVTSYQPNGARNFGLDQLPAHDARYRMAEEYASVVYALLEGSWDDDARVIDPAGGDFFNPDRIHRINHVGEHYRVQGPHLVEPSPQRTPVLFQAGASEAGRDFAARNAELAFLPTADPEVARADAADLARRAVAAGRDAQDIGAIVSLGVVIGSTEEEASRKLRDIRDNLDPEALRTFYSGIFGTDLATLDPSHTIAELKQNNAIRGGIRALLQSADGDRLTLDDVLRSAIERRFAGTPEQIADHIQAWLRFGVRGFNVVPVTTLGWWPEFIDHVVPVLQRRGLYQREYAPGTLRDKLFGRGPHLPKSHPARKFRGAFTGQ